VERPKSSSTPLVSRQYFLSLRQLSEGKRKKIAEKIEGTQPQK
jgi:hypothetical protein